MLDYKNSFVHSIGFLLGGRFFAFFVSAGSLPVYSLYFGAPCFFWFSFPSLNIFALLITKKKKKKKKITRPFLRTD